MLRLDNCFLPPNTLSSRYQLNETKLCPFFVIGPGFNPPTLAQNLAAKSENGCPKPLKSLSFGRSACCQGNPHNSVTGLSLA